MFIGDLLSQVENERTRPNPPFVAMNNACGRTKADFGSPATVLPILPIEIIGNVCQRLDICDLANLVRANSVLNVVGTRRLYHTIGVEIRPARLLQCMISLDHSADLPLLVRTLGELGQQFTYEDVLLVIREDIEEDGQFDDVGS